MEVCPGAPIDKAVIFNLMISFFIDLHSLVSGYGLIILTKLFQLPNTYSY